MMKFGANIEFSEEQIERLKSYLNEDWFKELNSKVNMYDEEASLDAQIEHIRKYILHYCQAGFQATQEDADNFFDLLSYYETKTLREPVRNKDGVIEIKKSGFNSGNAFYTGHVRPVIRGNGEGAYIEGIFVSTDRKEYIKKFAMDADAKLNSFEHHKQLRYNGTIAHEVFEYFGEKSANYLPAIYKPPAYYVITENFLSEKQELIDLGQFFKNKKDENLSENKEDEKAYKHAEILRLLENNIRIRYKNNMSEEEYNKLISKLKIQYIRQAFLKKVIGLADEQPKNIGIVITKDSEETIVPEINMSPAFDLDMSFDIAEERGMKRIQTNNGQTDIKSFIEEFADFDGFREFMDMVTRKMEDEETAIETILDKSYEASKATFFIEEESRTDYKNYLRARFRETKEAYKEVFLKPEREGIDDTEAILE